MNYQGGRFFNGAKLSTAGNGATHPKQIRPDRVTLAETILGVAGKHASFESAEKGLSNGACFVKNRYKLKQL